MKKFLLVLAAVALISLPVVMTSCDEDNPVNCTQMLDDVLDTAAAFIDTPTSTTCNAYKEALKDYVNSDCTLANFYQSDYDELSCSIY